MVNTDAGSVEFPAVCVEPPAAGRRRIAQTAKRWAADYTRSGTVPALETTPVQPGALIFTESAFDLGGRAGVRIYLVPELLNEVQQALGWKDADAVTSAFERALRDTCGGALALLVLRGPDSVDGLRARVDALLPCWKGLDGYKYVETPGEPLTLGQFVETRFAGLLAMWRKQETGDTARDLQGAVASLQAADATARLSAAGTWLTQLVARSDRIRHKRELGDSEVLRPQLAALEPAEREAIEAGSITEALTLLYGLDREQT